MNNVIEFRGLKFKTSLNFKNKKEEANYWDNLIIESIHKFRNVQKEYFSEKLHILMSYHIVCKYTAFLILLPILYFFGTIITWLFIALSLSSFVLSLLFYAILKTTAYKYVFTTTLNDNDEFMNILRDEIIKFKNETI